MKKSSIDKLNLLFNILEGNKTAQKVITEILRAEADDAKIGKFNIFDFAASKKEANKMPILAGIHHEKGYKIATDSHILVAAKIAYPEEMEKKTQFADGEISANYYPRWEMVLPQDLTKFDVLQIDKAKFLEGLKTVRAAYLAQTGKNKKFAQEFIVSIGGLFFRAELFDKMLKFADYAQTDKILIRTKERPCGYVHSEAGKCLIMPLCSYYDEEADFIIKL